jgi:hypothetical protein
VIDMQDVFFAEARRLLARIKLTLTGPEPFATNAATSQLADALQRHHDAILNTVAGRLESLPEKPNPAALAEMFRDMTSPPLHDAAERRAGRADA